ncbi:MAG: hypothetical protein U5Q44_10890 [Dehalococcoidia bacterium]|nr:hypothetical protein [Dehalococcoidia bacterium]
MALNMARGMLALVAVIALFALLDDQQSADAQTVEATWRIHDRAGTGSFEAGANEVTPGSGQEGYEIISFDAVGLSAGLSTYTYGGADLSPPQPQVVSCDAAFTGSSMALQVDGAYPYAGCVFFVGAENTGEEPIQVELGALDEDAEVACDTDGCESSDVDILAGGPDAATIGELCQESGGVANTDGLVYELEAGAEFVCPVFVTVLQPANENTTYQVEIVPPPPETEAVALADAHGRDVLTAQPGAHGAGDHARADGTDRVGHAHAGADFDPGADRNTRGHADAGRDRGGRTDPRPGYADRGSDGGRHGGGGFDAHAARHGDGAARGVRRRSGRGWGRVVARGGDGVVGYRRAGALGEAAIGVSRRRRGRESQGKPQCPVNFPQG